MKPPAHQKASKNYWRWPITILVLVAVFLLAGTITALVIG